MNYQQPTTVGIIGYGEVGQAFAERVVKQDVSTVVTNRSPDAIRASLDPDSGIDVASDPAAVAADSDIVLSCVWPETATEIAAAAAPNLDRTLYIDFNSIGVESVRDIAHSVDDGDGIFLNASIMGSVARQGANAPIAISGYSVDVGLATLQEYGFTVEGYGQDPERSAILKMCRSAITKGLLVVLTEALLPAQTYDLHEEVLDSVDDSFTDQTLGEFARLFLVDMTEHGARRAGELDEVISTIRAGGHDATVSERARWFSEQLAKLEGSDYEEVLTQFEDAT